MAVYGPSSCKKLDLIFKTLLLGTLSPSTNCQILLPNRVIRGKVGHKPNTFSDFEHISEIKKNHLLVFDDLRKDDFNDREFSKLATAGQHRKNSVIYVKNNLFQHTNWIRAIELETTHIIFSKSNSFY